MLPSSLTVLVTGLVLGCVALAAFAWAWRAGHLDDFDAQARVIFEPRDWRLERPWEGPAERAEREARYGPLIPPEPGEWGGAG
ncbi:MAG TPA: cbb3-type cytochrome oxidase assembly protein [Longimicrobiales bacterium]